MNSERFNKGFNCAQAVFSTYAPLLKIKEEDALRIATGFGARMGRLQEVCGAVTGAFMLISCKHGMIAATDTTSKEAAYAVEISI
jgi:C_GCAxxG_C_C family probable redox protein